MFCSKCGNKLAEGDAFCSRCGNRIEWERFIKEPVEEAAEAVVKKSAPEKVALDLDWELDEFDHKRERSIRIQWDDLIDEKPGKKEDINFAAIEEASKLSSGSTEKSPVIFNDINISSEDKTEDVGIDYFKQSDRDPDFSDDRFKSFNRKNIEFQELLEKERERIASEKREKTRAAMEAEAASFNAVFELDKEEQFEEKPEIIENPVIIPDDDIPGEEENISFFERRRRKKAERALKQEEAEEDSQLVTDENDFEGYWPEDKSEPAEEIKEEESADVPEAEEIKEPEDEEALETEKDSEPEAEEVSEAQPEPEEEPEGEASAKKYTQKISRDEFAEYLKQMESQYGIEEAAEIEEDIIPEILEETEAAEAPEEGVEEAAVEIKEEPAAEPQAEEPEAEEITIIEDIEEIAEPKEEEDFLDNTISRNAASLGLGVSEDEEFWEEEEKKSTFGTILIVFLSILLFAQVAILVIRFQFPDSQIAGFIEPKITLIENWLRGLF